jgi:uridine kinase
MERIPDTIMIAIATAIFVGGSVWGLAWWLSGQFTTLRSLVHEQITKTEAVILSKLEYHEKHDDSRFDDIKRDIWDVKLRAAANSTRLNDEIKRLDEAL